MIDAVIAGGLAGYGVAVPVGAIAAVIVSLAARTRLMVGVAAALGAATADGIYAAVAVLGGAAVAQAIAPFASGLRWMAALVLVGLAARMAVTAVRAAREESTVRGEPAVPVDIMAPAGPGRAYLSLLGLTLLNPATVVYFVALVLGSRPGGWGGAPAVVFVSAAFAASASWQLLLAGGGRVVGLVLTGRRGRLGTALVSSVVIVVLAVGLVAGG